ITVVTGIPEPVNGLRHQLYVWCRRNHQGDSNSLAAQSREPGIESGIVKVRPFSLFPMRTKMRLKLLAAGIPTATSPDGADPAGPGRPRRTTCLSQPKCLQNLPNRHGNYPGPRSNRQPTNNQQPTRCRSLLDLQA